jgi:hypothetical protein
VSATRPAAGAAGGKEQSVAPSHIEVVGEHRERHDQIVEERLARPPPPPRGELDNDAQLDPVPALSVAPT